MTGLIVFRQLVLLISFMGVFLMMNGCSSAAVKDKEQSESKEFVHKLKGNPVKHKSIFVFLDGTANDPSSETNIWKLYQSVIKNKDPQMTAIYIEGVGSVSDPVMGTVLGQGMEDRILRGYTFITQNYNLSDDIYIFGFSRGAHQARSLAGLISYSGIASLNNASEENIMKTSNEIIELVKKKNDQNYTDKWAAWKRGDAPLLAGDIKNQLKLEMKPAEIKFLGVWDTVPGSSLKKYGVCKEKIGVVKKMFWWIPGIDSGHRYKTDTYPPIKQIAHAVSIDEKRSKFAPLLLCDVMNKQYTTVEERWFPGAHADVGGGYEDSNELPLLSLEWMYTLLNDKYTVHNPPSFVGNPYGLAHWSVGDSPANKLSDCQERNLPEDAIIDPSYQKRQDKSPMPVRCGKKVVHLKYPIQCGIEKQCPEN